MFSTQRGDIYYADLNPVKGSEQGGEVRPVLVIQNDIGNMHSPTLIVAAITNRKKPDLPVHVALSNTNFLKDSSMVLLEQIRTIDRTRIKEYIGHIDDNLMREIDTALCISVGLNKNYCR